MAKKDKKTQADIDWENRILCRDESCIGTIGENGRCSVCGESFGSGDTDNGSNQKPESDAFDMENGSPDGDFKTDEGREEDMIEEDESILFKGIDWKNRTLCSDENCIGVIGPDGKCKECGKALI